MQSVETPLDPMVPVPSETPRSFDAPASDTSYGASLGPVGWGLITSAVAGVATVPVLMAVIGPTLTFGVILYPALLIGGIIGSGGLLVAGLVSNAITAVRSAKAAARRRQDASSGVVGAGQLAME